MQFFVIFFSFKNWKLLNKEILNLSGFCTFLFTFTIFLRPQPVLKITREQIIEKIKKDNIEVLCIVEGVDATTSYTIQVLFQNLPQRHNWSFQSS